MWPVPLFILGILTALPASHLDGQTLPAGGFGVHRFGPGDGMPGSYIPDLAVTGDGVLWVMASGRLTAFDGLVFQEHGVDPLQEGWGQDLVGIGAGRGDTLWVSVGQELLSYAGGRFRLRAEHVGILRDLWQEDDGRLHAWDDLGVVRLGEEGFQRVVELQAGWNWGRLPPYADEAGAAETVWLQDPRGGKMRQIRAEWVVAPLPFPDAWAGIADPDSLLVLRGAGATRELTTLGGRSIATIPAEPEQRALLVDGRGLLWVAVPGRVQAFTPSGDTVASLPLAPGAQVSAAVEDGEGNLWVGTVSDGLYRISGRPIRVVGAAEGLTDGQVAQVSAGGGEGVLALDTDGRVSRVTDQGVERVFESTDSAGLATAALTDRSGTTWIAVRGDDGTRILERGPGSRVFDVSLPSGSSPRRIVEDAREDGTLWMVRGQVTALRTRAPPGERHAGPYLPPDWGAREILAARDGSVWVAGPRGVARITDGVAEEFLDADGFPTGAARALHESADGTIWIGRYFGGLSRYREGRMGSVRAADGLWDDVASSVLEDDAGNLWMGSNRGIHRVARDEVEALLDGRASRVRGTGYGTAAGLRNPEASGWHGHRSPDGRLWFPTFAGLAVVDPAHARELEQAAPRVWIREGTPEGVRRVGAAAVALARGVRRLDVAYGATLLSGQAGLRYQVRMDGVDDDWVDVGEQRQVSYGGLPPGELTFRVRAVSGRGAVSPAEARLAVSVPPLFHETPAFRVLLVLLAAAAMAALHQLRMRQARARETALQGLVDHRTRELVRAQRETEGALATVEAQAAELRALDEAKSRFFANVSHELRTPLTLVQGPLQDVLDGRLGPITPRVRDQVATVQASGRRLGELIEQLLDVARLESGELHLDLRRQDLEPMLRRLASSFQALARSRGIAFEAAVPTGPLLVTADADHLEKVYANLLGNALKFTPEGGGVRFAVDVSGSGAEGTFVVTVDDDGPGIPEHERERIFQRFHQVDGSARRAHGGTGLGLAIAKEIVELHGGEIQVRSGAGGGSLFTVRLPAAGPEVQDGLPVQGGPLVPDGAALSGTGEAPAPSELPDDALRPTVLIVEDHPELRAYLRRHLEESYRVVEAANGAEGLEEARRSVPDLVLCDVMMPVMDGEAFCREIRSDPELSFLPMIMVTAKASRSSRLSALEGGADDYIVKPFDPRELRLRVANLLAARRRLEERLREEGKPLPVVEVGPVAAGGDARFARDLEAVLAEHMGDEDFGVDGLAKALAMSRATLYRKTDDALGESPMELLWRFRLLQAAHVFRETDATVSEVAYACGFKTVPHFTRRFRERFGVTPAAYRDGDPGERVDEPRGPDLASPPDGLLS